MLSDEDIYQRYQQKQTEFNKKAEISLVGHSLFDMWSDSNPPTPQTINGKTVANVGLSGTSTRQYLDVIVKHHRLPHLGKAVFIFLGVNDIVKEEHYSPKQVVDWLDEIVAKFRAIAPHSHYYLLEATPSIHRDNITNAQIKELNQYFAQHPPKGVQFIPTWQAFANAEDNLNPEYTTDGLHFSPKGYEVLLGILQKALH